MSKPLLLTVADEPVFIESVKSLLQTGFDVDISETAADALEFCQASQPAVILLDSDLPDADVLPLCRQLRGLEAVRQSVILLATTVNDPEDRSRAFEYGADEVLAKPLSGDDLTLRLNSLLRLRGDLRDLSESSQQAQSLALQSMTESAMYGAVVGFFRQIITCTTQEQLAEAFFSVMAQFSLNASIQVRVGQKVTWVAPGKEASDTEINLYEALKDSGRLYHFGARTLVNDQLVSFLVKNMPVEDDLAYGRYKDLVAVVIEGLQSSCQAIRRNDLIRLLFEELKTILTDVHANFGRDDSRVMQALSGLQLTLPEIHSSLHFLDLNEEQEAYFESLLNKGLSETETLVSFLRHLQGSLEKLGSRLGL